MVGYGCTHLLNLPPTRFRGHRDRKMKALSASMMDQAVASLLWKYLELPKDTSKSELEGYAREIVRRVHANASEAVIAEHIRILQSSQLCHQPNLPAIHDLARRAVAMVKRAGA